jgi:hypothetical protein
MSICAMFAPSQSRDNEFKNRLQISTFALQLA